VGVRTSRADRCRVGQVAARSGDMRAALEACSAALGELVRAAAAPPEAAWPDAAPLAAVPEAAEAAAPPASSAPGGGAVAPKRRLVSLGDMAAALSAAQGGACPPPHSVAPRLSCVSAESRDAPLCNTSVMWLGAPWSGCTMTSGHAALQSGLYPDVKSLHTA